MLFKNNRVFSPEVSRLATKCEEGGTYTRPLPLAVFASSFLIDFFEPVGNLLLIQGKLLRISNLLLRLEYFPETLFCPTTTYSGLCSSDHPCTKSLYMVRFLGKGVIYAEKIEIRWSAPNTMWIISTSLNFLKSAMLIYMLKPPYHQDIKGFCLFTSHFSLGTYIHALFLCHRRLRVLPHAHIHAIVQ